MLVSVKPKKVCPPRYPELPFVLHLDVGELHCDFCNIECKFFSLLAYLQSVDSTIFR